MPLLFGLVLSGCMMIKRSEYRSFERYSIPAWVEREAKGELGPDPHQKWTNKFDVMRKNSPLKPEEVEALIEWAKA
jgi:hypothetical protein